MQPQTGPQESSQTTHFAVSALPLETGLVASAMALSLILVPLPQSPGSQAVDVMLLGLTGFVLFLVAKMSLILRGSWSTWGPSPMRLPFKLSYVTGYLLMVFSTIGLFTV